MHQQFPMPNHIAIIKSLCLFDYKMELFLHSKNFIFLIIVIINKFLQEF